MTKLFSHPPHPSQLLLIKSKVDEITSPPKEPSRQGDPHHVPNFDLEPDLPVLYLPPLLSSLPETVPPVPFSTKYPPLTTQARLPCIDAASLSLHKALHRFRPLDRNYAIVPYPEAFNWAELDLPIREERDWYCVVFRSKRRLGSDGGPLYAADKLAHEEAVANGGLVMYCYGIPNSETGMNLATCIWLSRQHAIAALSKPYHVKAMRLAAVSFEVYELTRFLLRKPAGQTSVYLEPILGSCCEPFPQKSS